MNKTHRKSHRNEWKIEQQPKRKKKKRVSIQKKPIVKIEYLVKPYE